MLLAGFFVLTFVGTAHASTLPCYGTDVGVAQEVTTVTFCPPPLSP